jgi:hypothetical protein
MKLNSKLMGIIVLVVIFGGIAISSMLGYWNTESTGGQGQGDGAAAVTGETATESIRGKTTFQDILALGLAQETIEQVIGGPMPEPLTKVKDYCAAQGLDFETVKEALQAEIDKMDG